MDRRSFLKVVCASAGVAFAPDSVEEPKWSIMSFHFDKVLGVAGEWKNGMRHAVRVQKPTEENMNESIEMCKTVLRKWYSERTQKLAA